MRLFILFFIALSACTTTETQKYLSFGETIDAENQIGLSQLNEVMNGTDSAEVKFSANISAVCQMKGCWMTLENESGDDIRVTFKDYGFFVPKDASGKEAIISGVAKRVVLSPEEAEHFAEDQGVAFDPEKTYIEISVVADGVLIEADQKS